MRYSRLLFHPIVVFIFSIVALATSLFLYIYWYVEVSVGLKSVVSKANATTPGWNHFPSRILFFYPTYLLTIRSFRPGGHPFLEAIFDAPQLLLRTEDLRRD